MRNTLDDGVPAEKLNQVETALSALLCAVQDVRCALLQNDSQRLMECLARQTQALAACQSFETARTHRAHQHDRLKRLASDVDRVNRANQHFVRHALSLTERLLVDLTGGEPAGQGYSRAGVPGPCSYGRLLEARG